MVEFCGELCFGLCPEFFKFCGVGGECCFVAGGEFCEFSDYFIAVCSEERFCPGCGDDCGDGCDYFSFLVYFDGDVSGPHFSADCYCAEGADFYFFIINH